MNHPKTDELHRFARGELDEVRFEEVAAHVEACAQCSSALEETGAFPNLLDAASPNALSGKALAAGSSPADLPGTSRTASTLPRSTGISEGPGSIVGPYKLLQQLGEGGMGVVYMAEQERPVRRIVALKIIKPGMDSQQVIARFEAERQALAMMDHHNIAKVLDAGTTETGRPYFAMELVKGVPITEYCDKNKLTPRERLEMFIPVCQAIQHAHQKGIIHRDIKPSNVLVTLYDGQPVPKVIDFGIAKATQQKLTERTMFTGIGQILGTMEYMSPEQAEMNQLDVDTRTDVYSLGVMLYELLTGSTPITKDKLRGVGLEEMLRTIRETEPPKPSTRLSDSGEALPTISDVRKTEPTKLSKFVRGDLDWIVMKALEKDRTRRYETANGLAADVQRFLSDEAVEACPPSARYKLRKFARRNKAALVTGVAITAILLASTIVSSSLAVWAVRAEKLASANAVKAQTALKAEEQQRTLAEANEAKANRGAIKSREVATFLKGMLEGVGPSVALGRDTTMLREILDKTRQRLDQDLSDQPAIQAELRFTIGNVYRDLENYNEAAAQFRECLKLYQTVYGHTHSAVADTFLKLGEVQESQRHYDDAVESIARAVQIRRELLGDSHPDVVEATVILAWVKRHTHERADFAEAKRLMRDALATYEQNPQDNLLGIAQVLYKVDHMNYWNQDLLSEAEKKEYAEGKVARLQRALDIVRRGDGDEYRLLEGNIVRSLGAVYADQGDLDKAEAFFQEAIDIQRSLPGTQWNVMSNLAVIAQVQAAKADYAKSLDSIRRVIRKANKLFGEGSPRAVHHEEYLAILLYNQGHLTDALELQRKLADFRSAHGMPFRHAQVLHNLGYFLTCGYTNARRANEAEAAWRKAREIYTDIDGEDSERVLRAGRDLCKMLCMLGRIDEAVELRNEVALLDNGMWHTASVLNLISNNRQRNERLFEYALQTASETANAKATEQAVRAVLLDSDASHAHVGQAVKLAEQSLELATDQGKNHWQQLCLGMARYRQGRYAEADELLSRALESTSRSLRLIALSFAAMSALQQGDQNTAESRIDELGAFSALSTRIPPRFTLREGADVWAALHLQTELRALLPAPANIESLSGEARIKLGLRRQARHVNRQPKDVKSAQHLASLYAWYSKDQEHQEVCAKLMQQAQDSESADDQYQAAIRFLSYEESESLELVHRAKDLAQTAEASVDAERRNHEIAERLAGYQLACALAEIRLGNHLEADAWLKKAEPIVTLSNRGRWSSLCAINNSQLGKVTEAVAAVAAAELLIRPAPSRDVLSVDVTESQGDRLINWLLFDEAQAAVHRQQLRNDVVVKDREAQHESERP